MYTPEFINDPSPETLGHGAITINDNLSSIQDAINAITVTIPITAGEDLPIYTLVYGVNGVYYKGNPSLTTVEADIRGITLSAISSGQSGILHVGKGVIVNPNWTFPAATQLYLGAAGTVTDSTTGSTFVVPVGFAVSPGIIMFNRELGYDLFENYFTIDGDRIVLAYQPVNYTPTVVPEVEDIDQLGAHLSGIDLKIKAIEDRLTAHSI